MTDYIEIGDDAAIRTIRFNRPEKKNAITQDMYTAIADAIDAAQTDGTAVIVFLGHPGVFSAGNDIRDFMSRGMSGDLGSSPTFRFLKSLATSKVSMLAGIDGLAIGVGATMLMHCDMVFATTRSTLKTPFLSLGLVPEAASSLIAPRIMGHQRAFELLVMGETFSAEDAKAAGLINRIVDEDMLERTVIEAGLKLAAQPPQARAFCRQLVKGDPLEITRRMDEEALLFAERLTSAEAREAFTAFMEKRPANFKAVD